MKSNELRIYLLGRIEIIDHMVNSLPQVTPRISLSFKLRGFRIQAYENDIQILKLCVKYGVEIMLGSDAHREEDVGDFTRTEKILKEVDFPEELIVNRSLSYVKNWLRV